MFIGLDAEDYDRKYSDKELFKRIIGYFKKYRKQIAIVSIVLSVSSLASSLVFVFSSFALNLMVSTRDISSIL